MTTGDVRQIPDRADMGGNADDKTGSSALMQDAAEFQQVLTELVRIQMFRDRDRSSSHDVGVPGAHALDILVRMGPIGLGQLSRELFVDKSTASRLVSMLDEKGYISRTADRADRRFAWVNVTPAGRELHARIQQENLRETAVLLRSFAGDVRQGMTARLRHVASTAAVNAGISDASICVTPSGDEPVPFGADLRTAGLADLQEALTLLRSADLSVEGVAERFLGGFLVAREPNSEQIIGMAGVESSGTVGLLRSVVVHPSFRGSGLGRVLVRAVSRFAGLAGTRELYVLTELAGDFFLQHGWERIPRSDIPEMLEASLLQQGLSSSTATALRLRLT
jgi:amino-acid N-acetyltransferase